jgi:uncharacterized protein YuzE
MKSNKHHLIVQSNSAPVVEWDSTSGAVYIRFKRTKVARTLDREAAGHIITVDIDRAGDVVGIEALFIEELEISKILKRASVRAPSIDFSRARFRSTPSHHEEEEGCLMMAR